MGNTLTRRDALALGVAAAAAPAVPLLVEEAAVKPTPLPAWTIGTPGQTNWRVVFAANEVDARLSYAERECLGEQCPGCHSACLECVGVTVTEREPHLDRFSGREIPDSALFEIGWDVLCSRCSYAVSEGAANGHIIDGLIICEDCLTADEVAAIEARDAALREVE